MSASAFDWGPRSGYDDAALIRRAHLFVEMLNKVTLKNFPLPISVKAEVGIDTFIIHVAISYWAPDRDTGERIKIARQEAIRPVSLPTSDDPKNPYALFWLRRTLREMMAHEIEEAFHFAGVRLYDPHAKERP